MSTSQGTPREPAVGIDRGRTAYGGVKWGAAFFGWLTATGLVVLLTAVVAAIGTAVGVSTGGSAADAVQQASRNAQTVGLTGAIALLVIVFVSYYCGGYVAGRMSRFNGLRQGLAVWIWAVVIAVIVAVVAAVAGSRYDIFTLNNFPRLPVDQGRLTTGGIITLLVLLVVSLAGALLGGMAGMRFHRKVDQASSVVD